jgi:putative heme-binding domain-containing protein
MKKFFAMLAFVAVGFVAAEANAADGKQVYQKNGCMACHAIGGQGGKIGPALDKSGEKGKDYILESIVDPNKTVTKGYAPNIMPKNFKDKIKGDELTALVDYLAGLK